MTTKWDDIEFLGHLTCPVCKGDSWVVNFIRSRYHFKRSPSNSNGLDVSCTKCGLHCIDRIVDIKHSFQPMNMEEATKYFNEIIPNLL